MIKSFKDTATKDVFNDRRSRAARRACPEQIWRVARRKLEQIESVEDLRLLNIPPANRLEEGICPLVRRLQQVPAGWFEHATHLRQVCMAVRYVLEYIEAQGDIEVRIWEGQP